MNIKTVGDIAKDLNVDRDAVSYAIRKLKIEPIGMAGIVRLFPETTVIKIKNYLETKRKYHKSV